MGGPAMIEGGGLGVYAPERRRADGRAAANGVVDVLVADERAAVAAARGGAVPTCRAAGARDGRRPAGATPSGAGEPAARLRRPPGDRRLLDEGSRSWNCAGTSAPAMLTVLARIDGRPSACWPTTRSPRRGDRRRRRRQGHPVPAAVRRARRCRWCRCATRPGSWSGRTRSGRRRAPLRRHVRRRRPTDRAVGHRGAAQGLRARRDGDGRRLLAAPRSDVAWPTGSSAAWAWRERSGSAIRKELDAIADPADAGARFAELVAELYERGKALNAATAFEIDDVIDPAATRSVIAAALTQATR